MKTWVQLLGTSAENCSVEGPDIVREEGPRQFRRLWSFDTRDQAEAVFFAWCKELEVIK